MYTDPDPRTYPLSSYSYLILPTEIQGQFTEAKGQTLARSPTTPCARANSSRPRSGYSPMPINLVEASFAQIAKIPGADVQTINIQSCNNPTFSPNGTNLLADDAPYPPACDKQGADPVRQRHRRGHGRGHRRQRAHRRRRGGHQRGWHRQRHRGHRSRSGGVPGSCGSNSSGASGRERSAKSKAAALAPCAAQGKTASDCTAAGGSGTAGTDPEP